MKINLCMWVWYVCDISAHVHPHVCVCVCVHKWMYKEHMQEANGGCQELSVYLHLFNEAESVLKLGACVFSTSLEACYSQVSSHFGIDIPGLPWTPGLLCGFWNPNSNSCACTASSRNSSSHPSRPQLAISNNTVITWSHCVLAKNIVISFIVFFLIKRIHKLIVQFDFDSLF